MVYMILGEGFEETEAIFPCDILRRCGVELALAGIGGREIESSHGVVVRADLTVGEIDQRKLDMIILPGGGKGVASIKASPEALRAVREAWDGGKYVAAICAAPTVLAMLGITDGKMATCYPGCEKDMGSARMQKDAPVVADGRLITGQAAGAAAAFGLKLAEILRGPEAAARVAAGMVIR